MDSYIEKFLSLENSSTKITKAWHAGNEELIDSMGDDYFFLDENEIGTAMVTDEKSIDAIKKSLANTFNDINESTLTPLAKSVASGSYFKAIGKSPPKPISKQEEITYNSNIVMVNEFEKADAQKIEEIYAKAKQTGRGNSLFHKLMPGDLDGKYMGKTGKFLVEYPSHTNIADILNSKVGEIADFVDEQLGNEDYDDIKQRIFISKELQKENTSVCAVMYHGIQGCQNKEISAAVKEAIRDAVPQPPCISIGKTYSVLNTELSNAELAYSSNDNATSKHKFSKTNKQDIKHANLNESFAPTQPSFERSCFSL